MGETAARGASQLLDGLPAPDRHRAERILAASPALEIDRGVPYFQSSFAAAALLVVEDGLVVVRTALPPSARSVVTCEAGPGALLVPPRANDMLIGFGKSSVTALSAEVLDQLVAIPAVAGRIVEQLSAALVHRQEAIANFAQPRHLERVRRKLLFLARRYGHVVREGVRIDLPLSHALLAEMIGSSRETVTRALDELQRDGFVVRVGSTYWLRVPADSVFQSGRREVGPLTRDDGHER